MANATKEVNYRVVIPVNDHPWMVNKDEVEKNAKFITDHANDLAKVIRPVAEALSRHYGKPSVESDTVCAFCEYPWESAREENGKPACCDKAIDLWETNHPDSQQF